MKTLKLFGLVLPLGAGLLIASAGSASGQIIYSGVQNITATVGNPAGFDVDGDGGNDFTFSIVNIDNGLFSTTRPHVELGHGAAGVTALMADLDGGNLTVFFEEDPIPGNISVSGPAAEGIWTESETDGSRFFGFSIGTEELPLYGWARFNYDSDLESATVVDWAYESSGGAIATGAIPEPATTAAMTGFAALLAGSVAAWRRREKRA